MICKRITYENFRNIKEQTLELSPEVNVLYGDNAEGKTNALEGICVFATGKTFRQGNDRDLISFDSEVCRLKNTFVDKNREQEMEIKLVRGSRRSVTRNGVPVKRTADMLGYFRAVLFCPEHLSIVKDGPAERRSFLDAAISQLKPFYLTSLQKYFDALEQRNRLIREYEENRAAFDSTVDLWSGIMAREAALISKERAEYVKRLDVKVGEFFSDMTNGEEKTSIEYYGEKTEDEFVRLFSGDLEREVAAGTTLHGVQKDDFIITLNGREARVYCSQGQQRSLALAMKMGEGEISREVSLDYPVFLLDDIFSELDDKRKNYLLNGIKGKQVIITSCERIDPGVRAAVFHVSKGSYTPIREV